MAQLDNKEAKSSISNLLHSLLEPGIVIFMGTTCNLSSQAHEHKLPLLSTPALLNLKCFLEDKGASTQ
jgi:hypothetical protein